jgi:hypothetical protein
VYANYGHAKIQPVYDVQKDGWGIASTCESQSSMSAGLLPDMANRVCGGTPPPVPSPAHGPSVQRTTQRQKLKEKVCITLNGTLRVITTYVTNARAFWNEVFKVLGAWMLCSCHFPNIMDKNLVKELQL